MKNVTQYYILTVLFITLVYNFFARVFGGTESTISYVMNEAGNKWPILVGLVFAVVAHWFWPIGK